MQASSRLASALSWLRARAGGWFAGAFAVCFACAQFTYSVVMRDPNDQKWFWVATLATLALAAFAARLLRERELRLDSMDALLAALILYATLSLTWSPDRVAGLMSLAKIVTAAVIFSYLKDFGDESLFRRLVAWTTFATATVLALAYTQPGAWGGFHNPNFITEYLLLALPFCLGYGAIAASRIRRAGAAVTILAAFWYLVVDNPSRIEFMIVPVALAAAAGVFCGRRWGWRPVLAIGAPVSIGLVLAAIAFWDAFPFSDRGLRDSFLPRIALQINTFSMWLDAPLLGHGAGSFQYLFPTHQEDHLHKFNHETVLFGTKHVVAGAAHNEYLELLSTFGLAGAAIAAVFAWRMVRIVRAGPAFGPVQYAALAAILVWMLNAVVEFPLQNPATLVLALTSVAMLAAGRDGVRPGTRHLRVGSRTAAMLAAAALSYALGIQILCDRFIDASKYYRLANHLMGVGDARNAYLAMREAHLSNPWEYQIRAALFLNAVILMDAESWSATTWGERLRRQPFLSGHIDALYAIATSAGRQPGVLNSRLYYLVRSGNFRYQRAESDAALAFLRRNAAQISDTWRMDALYGALYADLRQMAAAREAAVKNGAPFGHVEQIRGIEALVRAGPAGPSQEQKSIGLEGGLPPVPKGIVRRLDPQD